MTKEEAHELLNKLNSSSDDVTKLMNAFNKLDLSSFSSPLTGRKVGMFLEHRTKIATNQHRKGHNCRLNDTDICN